MTPTLDPQTADVITFWIALAIAIAALALLLSLVAHARISRLRRELARQTPLTPTSHQPRFDTGFMTTSATVTSPVSVDPGSVSPRVRQLASSGRKIEAIKALREETGLRLRDAKDVVDRL